MPGGVVLPGWVLDAVSARAGRRAIPPTRQATTERDNSFYEAWDELSRDRERFAPWMQENVLEAKAS